jgi:hypothetical protein
METKGVYLTLLRKAIKIFCHRLVGRRGGVVVIVLATGPKVRGFEPMQCD